MQQLPLDIQDKLLNLSLTERGTDQIRSFLKLYISRYGVECGPLLNLPFHPKYPFITNIHLNGNFNTKFPKEAYLLLWYLVDVYSIGMIINKSHILRYINSCTKTAHKEKYKVLLKWLQLFGNIPWWQHRLTEEDVENCRFIFVVFKCSREIIFEEEGTRIIRKYQCDVQPGYNTGFNTLVDYDDQINEKRRTEFFMCRANGIDPSTVPNNLFSPDSSKEWYNTESYPQDFIQEIQACIVDFNNQYNWDKSNPDHPIYRVDGLLFSRYIPRLKIYVNETSECSDSDESGFSFD